MKNMAIEEHRLVAERQDGRDSDFVAVCNLNFRKRRRDFLASILFGQVETQHGARCVRHNSFDLDVAERSRSQYATGEFENFRELGLAIQLVDGWPSHHAFD